LKDLDVKPAQRGHGTLDSLPLLVEMQLANDQSARVKRVWLIEHQPLRALHVEL
jgi:hypothetical protein